MSTQVPGSFGWAREHQPQHTARCAGCTCGWKGKVRRTDPSGRGIPWLLGFDHRQHIADIWRDHRRATQTATP